MSTFILSLSDPRATLETVGGKGMSLGKLAFAGFPVPDGFHITTDAYRRFVSANDLQAKIIDTLHGAALIEPAAAEAASTTIRELFDKAEIPEDIASAIRRAYAELCSRKPDDYQGLAVAVRSSATAEDLPGASFAGQQETYLNIRGAEAVVQAVRKCWASLWTARAIAYRAKQGIAPDCVALAVVVQELVCADAAGVMFTANPISGKRDEIMITATWGLGEAIVSGLVTPDTLTVEKSTGKMIRRETAEKSVMTVRTESGTSELPVPNSRKKKPVLNDAQARSLATVGADIECLYEMPMDIEWTLAAGNFAIVQARPITALPSEAATELAPKLEWPLPHPKAVLARGSFAEFVPEPVTPLFATLAIPIARKESLRLMGNVGMADQDSYLFSVINDYVYVGFIFTPRMIWKLLGATLFMFKGLLETAQPRAEAARAKSLAVADKWQSRELASLSPSELLDGAAEIFRTTAVYYTEAQSGTIPVAMLNEVSFSKYYGLLVKSKGDPEAFRFVFGTENHAMRAEKALYDLAMWVKGKSQLESYLGAVPAEEICAALASDTKPIPELAEFAERFDAYLDKYGRAIYDMDFAKPVPAEAPAPLVETLKVYLSGKNSPFERQRAALELREQATKSIARRLDPLRRKYFLKLVKTAQDTAPLREDSIADLGLGYPQIRRLLGELGRRLAARGVIACADDIYWLEMQELEGLAAPLQEGLALKSLATDVERRKAKWQAMRSVTPPTTLPKVKWMAAFYPSGENTGNTIKGFAASAGRVTARACVMLGPEDFGRMQPGDVIVAGITTPAWTPLFARAAGIVTDIGGPLSHSSIVAREYGIPAVLATGVGTRRIKDGQTITVDGTRGQVILESSGEDQSEHPPPPPEWIPSNPGSISTRISFVEFVPDVVSPLFATLALPIASDATLKMQVETLGLRGEPAYYFEIINGYVFATAVIKQSLKIVLSLISMTRKIFQYGKARLDEVPANCRALAETWRQKDLAEVKAGDLLAGVRELFRATADYFLMAQSWPIPRAAWSESLFSRFYNALVKRRSDPAAATFLLALESLPLRAEKSLFDLSQWAKGQANLADYLMRTPAEDIWATLQADCVSDPVLGEFADRLAAHLAAIGHVIYDLDFAKPLPAEEPGPVLEIIKAYLAGRGSNPQSRQQAQAELRDQAEQAITPRLDPLRRKWFRNLLRLAQECAPERENAIADLGLAYPQLRRLLRELGRRLVSEEAIANPDDVYWLEAQEANALAGNLDKGERLTNYAASIEIRKANWLRARKLTPPAIILPRKFGLSRLMMRKGSQGNSLKGLGASPGKVTAPARVLRGSDDFGLMRPGDVIVAVTTTPAWTPLFARAAGIVTDIGGPFSHSSIVAREYGIPAVLATGVGTRRIKDGQTITVDGTAGTVTLSSL